MTQLVPTSTANVRTTSTFDNVCSLSSDMSIFDTPPGLTIHQTQTPVELIQDQINMFTFSKFRVLLTSDCE